MAERKNSIINVRGMLPDHTLLGIKIWARNDKNELAEAVEADSAVLNSDGSWQLKNIRRSIMGTDKSKHPPPPKKLGRLPSDAT
ncbi:putative permease [Neisseria gonorrhoeae]|uniref:Putative permease n=1 Tax=Neisseria gonorrhoeae TaxID=485 RepID=A0A378VX70_NEIGO|nr:putative permease [Neisseria gonorrhoeae]